MAVTVVALETASDTNAGSAEFVTTGEVVFPANTIAIIVFRNTAGTADVAQAVTTTGLTWASVASLSNAAVTSRVNVWAAAVGGSPVTGTTVISWAGGADPVPTSVIWGLGYITGFQRAGTPAAVLVTRLAATRVTSTAWNALDVVSAFQQPLTSGTLAVQGHGNAETAVHPTGWAELGDDSESTPNGMMNWAWIASASTTPDFSWASSSTYIIIVLEVKANVDETSAVTTACVAAVASLFLLALSVVTACLAKVKLRITLVNPLSGLVMLFRRRRR